MVYITLFVIYLHNGMETIKLIEFIVVKKSSLVQSWCVKEYRCAPVSRAVRSKTYRGYVNQRIIPNFIHNVIFV
jgi:hypothetical protein